MNAWFGMRRRLRKCDVAGLPVGVGDNDDDLLRWFNEHNSNVRQFAREHPSHTVVEIDIEARHAGRDLERAFGIPQKCFEKRNAKHR